VTLRGINVCSASLYLLRDRHLGSDGRAARSVCSGISGNYTVDHVPALGDACDCLMVVHCWVRLMADVAGSSKSTCTVSDTFTSLSLELYNVYRHGSYSVECYIRCSTVWVVGVCLQMFFLLYKLLHPISRRLNCKSLSAD